MSSDPGARTSQVFLDKDTLRHEQFRREAWGFTSSFGWESTACGYILVRGADEVVDGLISLVTMQSKHDLLPVEPNQPTSISVTIVNAICYRRREPNTLGVEDDNRAVSEF
jgi:hypothetical protein